MKWIYKKNVFIRYYTIKKIYNLKSYLITGINIYQTCPTTSYYLIIDCTDNSYFYFNLK